MLLLTQGPKDRHSCEGIGGKWGFWGMMHIIQCNTPTKDAGEVCSDSSDCEGGVCLSDLPEDEVARQFGHASDIQVMGKCTEWRLNFGCFAAVTEGTLHFYCID